MRTFIACLLVTISGNVGGARAQCAAADIIKAGYSNTEGGYRKWQNFSDVSYSFDETLAAPFPSTLRGAVTAGFALWDAGAAAISVTNNSASGNKVFAKYQGWAAGSDVLGATYAEPDGQGYITSFSVYFNLQDFAPSHWVSGTSCPIGTNDISMYAAAMHEFGHVLGFVQAAPSCSETSTVMNEGQGRGDCWSAIGSSDLIASVWVYGLHVNSAADIEAFSAFDEYVEWFTLFEHETREYVLEGANSWPGPWTPIAIEPPAVGPHSVRVQEAGCRVVRLVEIETTGRRQVLGTAQVGKSLESSSTVRQEDTREMSDKVTLATERRRLRETACANTDASVISSPPTYVIFSGSGYVNAADEWVKSFWEAKGHVVELVDVGMYPPETRQSDIDNAIANYYTNSGTKYFHLIGDSQGDPLSSEYWDTSEYWQSRRDAALFARSVRVEEWSDNTIPMFLRPDHEFGPDNTAHAAPFLLSDQNYADVDGDLIPDVVVTRWPVESVNDVIFAADKMQGHVESSEAMPHLASFFVGDDDGTTARGLEVRNMTGQIASEILACAPGEQVNYLYESDNPDAWYRNVTTAAQLNTVPPAALIMMSWFSGTRTPAHFFWKSFMSGSNPILGWNMEMLNEGVVIPFVISASCFTADYDSPNHEVWGRPVCDDFLFEYDKGAVAWIGPMTGSFQSENYVVAKYVVEELYENPYRSMAESWLIGVQRAYAEYTPAIPATIYAYAFLGDPVSPFAKAPSTEVAAFAQKASGGGSLEEMSGSFAVACPGRDADGVVVEVKIDAGGVFGAVESNDLVLGQPTDPSLAFFPDGEEIFADAAPALHAADAEFPNGYYGANFTVASIGGCGVDSALVSLQGIPLGYAQLNIRSPDMVINAIGTRGKVGAADYSKFGLHMFSSICDCVHENPYSACADFAAPDTSVTMPDFSFFGVHYGHGDPQGGGNPSSTQLALSAGAVRLKFVEEQPLTGPHVLRADVILEGIGPFTAAVIALANGNDRLEYIEWSPDTTFPGESMCTSLERDGAKQVFLGVLGSKNASSGIARLGTVTFRVHSDDPVALTEADFALLTADILDVAGQVRQVSPANRRTSFEAPSYRNELAQNYPNPFNPTTTIAFSLAGASDADLRIYDVRGAAVRTLVHERRQAGLHRVDWDGHNDRGQPIASGVYFYKLVAGSFTDTKKMTILK